MLKTNATLTHKRCACPTCGEVFSTLSNFDRHRIGDTGDKSCALPEFVGLELKQGSNGTWWGMPGRIEDAEQSAG